MDGKVSVESKEGVGSTFSLLLPLEQAQSGLNSATNQQKSKASEKLSETAMTHQILVVEDNRINQIIAENMLRKLGLSCDIAVNGLEALTAVANKKYSLIFMDMQMPVMDGISATKKIVEKYGNKRPTIVAMTANAFQKDKDRCINAGMNDFIAKPFDLAELVRVLSQYDKVTEIIATSKLKSS
jgi:CheY-like chemotaxis protein